MQCNKIVRLDAEHAVARVSVAYPAQTIPAGTFGEGLPESQFPGRTVDYYWYLERTDRWRLTALRTLAATGLLEMSAWGFPEVLDLGEEHTRKVANARLTPQSDRELAHWFAEHEKEIAELSSRARALVPPGERRMFRAREEDEASESSPLEREFTALSILWIEVQEDGSIELLVGGMADNTVLFRHSADGSLPRVTPDEFIWAEALTAGWCLVRTT